jgi:superoxide dismutase, Cu-Zn family
MTRSSLAALALALAVPLWARAATTASAELKDGNGAPVGVATFTAAAGGVALKVEVHGLKPGRHGIHVHAVGSCVGPDFKSAGGHLNPTGKMHGLENPKGHHAGDLPNLTVAADGTGSATARLDGTSLGEGEASLLHAGGTSIVIHADADDEKTDPAGNSGARIACGVITAAR